MMKSKYLSDCCTNPPWLQDAKSVFLPQLTLSISGKRKLVLEHMACIKQGVLHTLLLYLFLLGGGGGAFFG